MEISLVSLLIFAIGVIGLPIIFIKFIAPESLKKQPGFAFVVAAFFVLIGFMAAFFVFMPALSMAMLAFSSLLLLPFVILMIEPSPEEEVEKEVRLKSSFNLDFFSRIMKKHEKLITFYMLLFFGMVIEYMLLFAFLPPGLSDTAFSQQLQAFGPVGKFSMTSHMDILVNNLQVLFIAFALSVFYGAGSLLILNLNASIAGVMYGAPMKILFWGSTVAAPVYTNLLAYIPHTVIEIVGYLFAAVAGGILAMRQNKEELIEAIIMFSIGVALIFIGYIVEINLPAMIK
jgi:uncharacterized membrane protein SpoIIM required for sporulation